MSNFRAQIQNRLMSSQLRVTKVPYSGLDLAMIRNEIVSALEETVRAGTLSSYTVVMPDINDIPDSKAVKEYEKVVDKFSITF